MYFRLGLYLVRTDVLSWGDSVKISGWLLLLSFSFSHRMFGENEQFCDYLTRFQKVSRGNGNIWNQKISKFTMRIVQSILCLELNEESFRMLFRFFCLCCLRFSFLGYLRVKISLHFVLIFAANSFHQPFSSNCWDFKAYWHTFWESFSSKLELQLMCTMQFSVEKIVCF